MKTIVLTIALHCLMLGLAGTASAFDGNRKGFVLGFGLGHGLTNYQQTMESGGEKFSTNRKTKLSFITDFRLGSGRSEQLLIYYMNKVSWFDMRNALGKNTGVANGCIGVGVTYFLKPVTPCGFVSGGIGISYLSNTSRSTDTWAGLGIVGGAGYEIAPHWCFEGTIMYGRTVGNDPNNKGTANSISIAFIIAGLSY